MDDRPLIAPSGEGMLDTGTGRPVSDAYFGSVNSELTEKGFLVTSADDLIRWARTGSLPRKAILWLSRFFAWNRAVGWKAQLSSIPITM